MNRHKVFSTERLTCAALLVALQIVLGNLVQIPFVSKQYNLGFLPIAIAGALLGAPWAVVVGGLGDFLGAHLFPAGAYYFGFTLTNMLAGLCYALPLYARNPGWLRVTAAVVLASVCNLFLNSFWLSLLYTGKAYWGWVSVRAVSYAFETPASIVLCFLTLKGMKRIKLLASVSLPYTEASRGMTSEGENKE